MFRAHLRLLLCCTLLAAPTYGVDSTHDEAISAVAVAIAKILPEHVKVVLPGADKDRTWISIAWDIPFVEHH